MDRANLQKAATLNPKGLYRLAKYLRLNTVGMRPQQVARLVAWRTSRRPWT